MLAEAIFYRPEQTFELDLVLVPLRKEDGSWDPTMVQHLKGQVIKAIPTGQVLRRRGQDALVMDCGGHTQGLPPGHGLQRCSVEP